LPFLIAEDKFEARRNNGTSVRDDLRSCFGDTHYLAFAGRDPVQRNPSRLMPNPSCRSFLFFLLHCECCGLVNLDRV
jgi:hypothetical protein